MKILQVKSSVFNGSGQSSRLAEEFVALLREQHPDAKLIQRDLVADPVPHLDGARAGAFFAKPEERSAEQRAVIAYSDTLIDELRGADVLVLGLPMYNFGVPSQLKAWFDHIARAGVTFKYTEKGAANTYAFLPVSRPTGPFSVYLNVSPARAMWSNHALSCEGTPKLYIGSPSTSTSAPRSSSISASE